MQDTKEHILSIHTQSIFISSLKNMKKINYCVVCKNKKFFFLEKVVAKNFTFFIYSCNSCRLLFQNPMPTKQFLKKFYSNIYKKKYHLTSTEKAFEVKNSL